MAEQAHESSESQPVGPFAGYRVTPPPQTSGMAVASLVCSLFGMLVPIVPSLVGIGLGVSALKRLRGSVIETGRGFAIAGIVVGLVGMVLTSTCIGVFIGPALWQSHEATAQAKCAENLRNVGNLLLAMATDQKGTFPPKLDVLLRDRHVDGSVLRCPADPDGETYIYLGDGLTTAAPAETVLAYERIGRHGGGMNVLFVDGRVHFVREGEAKNVVERLQAGQNPPWSDAE